MSGSIKSFIYLLASKAFFEIFSIKNTRSSLSKFILWTFTVFDLLSATFSLGLLKIFQFMHLRRSFFKMSLKIFYYKTFFNKKYTKYFLIKRLIGFFFCWKNVFLILLNCDFFKKFLENLFKSFFLNIFYTKNILTIG